MTTQTGHWMVKHPKENKNEKNVPRKYKLSLFLTHICRVAVLEEGAGGASPYFRCIDDCVDEYIQTMLMNFFTFY